MTKAKGSIRSIHAVRNKCSLRGECWVWRGHYDNRGLPRGSFLTADGRKQLGVRRWVFEAHTGHKPAQLVGTSCETPGCCNPLHLIPETYSERNRRSIAGIAVPALKAQRIRTGRAANGLLKLTAEQVRAIRADSRPGRVIAPEYGVSPATVWDIRAGKTWAEAKPVRQASVFAFAAMGGIAA